MPAKRKTRKQKQNTHRKKSAQAQAQSQATPQVKAARKAAVKINEPDLLVVPAHYIKKDLLKTITVSLILTAIILSIYFLLPNGNITELLSK
jgi:hypothetical protein